MVSLFSCSLLSAVALILSATSPLSGTLTVRISNVKNAKGEIAVALYNSSETFLTKKGQAYLKRNAVNTTGAATIQFDNLPHGTYAIAIYHDINGNRELDKNMLGIPSEPYGFSNNIVPTFRVPTFDETKFSFRESSRTLTIGLQTWKLN